MSETICDEETHTPAKRGTILLVPRRSQIEQIQRKFQVRRSTPEDGPRPTDPGWRGKEGTASGIKNKEGAQSLGKKTLTFFPWRHTTAARRESRMTEVEIRRPKAGCATRPIAQTGPAIGMRAGTWLVAKTRKSTAGWCFFAPRSNREIANNETTTTTTHPELRDPGPIRPTIDLENWLARYLSGTEKCHCNTVVRNRSSRQETW